MKITLYNYETGETKTLSMEQAIPMPFSNFVEKGITLLDDQENIMANRVWPIIEDNLGYSIEIDDLNYCQSRNFRTILKTYIRLIKECSDKQVIELRQWDRQNRPSRILTTENLS